MSQGRHANPAPKPQADTLNRVALAEDSAAMTVLAQRSTEIAERFGDGMAYDQSRVVSEARVFMATGAMAMLELGKRLIQIKENEPHGTFESIVVQRLGISARSARRMMQAAVKYMSPALAGKTASLAVLDQSKLFDLLDESEEDLKALAEGGTLAGMTIGEIDAMTSKELRAKLKEAEKKLATKDRQLGDKSKKIDDLDAKLRVAKREGLELSEAEGAQVQALRDTTLDAEQTLLRLLAEVDDVLRMPATPATEACARHSVDYLVQRIVDACLERGITVDLAERVSPLWNEAIESAAAAGTGKGRR